MMTIKNVVVRTTPKSEEEVIKGHNRIVVVRIRRGQICGIELTY